MQSQFSGAQRQVWRRPALALAHGCSTPRRSARHSWTSPRDITPGLPTTDNFQHWPPWRPLVVDTARRVLDYTGGTEAARTWLHDAAEVIDTTHLTPAQAAQQIADAVKS